MCKKNLCILCLTNEMVRKVFVCWFFSLMCRVWAECDWRCVVSVSLQAPTTTGRCMKPWTSAGSSCESSPRRCWRGFPRAPCPSSTPESPPAATRGRRPDLHLLLPVSCFEGHRGGQGSFQVFSSGVRAGSLVCIFFCQKVCIDSFNVFPSVYSKFHLCSYLFVYVTAIFPPLLFHIVSVCCSNRDNKVIVA